MRYSHVQVGGVGTGMGGVHPNCKGHVALWAHIKRMAFSPEQMREDKKRVSGQSMIKTRTKTVAVVKSDLLQHVTRKLPEAENTKVEVKKWMPADKKHIQAAKDVAALSKALAGMRKSPYLDPVVQHDRYDVIELSAAVAAVFASLRTVTTWPDETKDWFKGCLHNGEGGIKEIVMGMSQYSGVGEMVELQGKNDAFKESLIALLVGSDFTAQANGYLSRVATLG